MTTKLLRKQKVLEMRGIGLTKIHDEINESTFTPPIKLGSRASAWPEHEIEAYNKARIAGATEDQLKALTAQLMKQREQIKREFQEGKTCV